MRNLIGQVLLGQYRVESFVASGGMGAVYKVWDLKRNVPLAMKVLHSEMAEDPSIFKRFKREANMLKKLAHPNIVPFYGVFETSSVIFLLERFINGPSLKQILKERASKSFSIIESLSFLKALSAALGYAHVNGVVHCDVKPGNVMIDQGGNIYLTDFGIARYAESTTTTLATVGTAAYMAPEQIRGEPVSAATDVYALGVMLFEFLTGERLFRGTEAGTESAGPTGNERIRYAHLNILPPNPSSVNSSIPEALSAVIVKTLAKRPEDRFPSTQEMFLAACNAVALYPGNIPDRLPLTELSAFGAKGTLDESGRVGNTQTTQIPTRRIPVWFWVLCGAGAVILILFFTLNSKQTIAFVVPTYTPTGGVARPTILSPSPLPSTIATRVKPTTQPSRTVAPRPTSTPRPTPTPTIYCPPSGYRIGDWVYVSYGQGRQILWSSNRIDSGSSSYASEAEVMELVNGPVCNNGFNLWHVQTGAGQQGWIVEAEGNQSYLEPIPAWSACPNAPSSHLHENDRASISFFPNRENNVREKSGLDSKVIGYLTPGTVVKIINGPDCNDGFVWWRVQLSKGGKGWTAEGDSSGYWMIPYKK